MILSADWFQHPPTPFYSKWRRLGSRPYKRERERERHKVMEKTVLEWFCACVKNLTTAEAEGGQSTNTSSSIKSPILCCVKTETILLDLHDLDACPTREEEGEGGRKKRGGAAAIRRVLSIWKRGGATKQSKTTPGFDQQQQQQEEGQTPQSRDGGDVSLETALIHSAPEGEAETLPSPQDSSAYTEDEN